MLNIFEAIENRQLVPTLSNDDVSFNEYMDLQFDSSQLSQIVIFPSGWLNGSNKQCLKITEQILKTHFVSGVFELGTIWRPINSISFTAIVVMSKKPKQVEMARYTENPVDTKKSSGSAKLTLNIVYRPAFLDFIKRIEQCFDSKMEKPFFNVNYKKLEANRLAVHYYEPDNQIDLAEFKNEKLTILGKHFEIIKPSLTNKVRS